MTTHGQPGPAAVALTTAWAVAWTLLFSLAAIPALTLWVACRRPFGGARAAMRDFRLAVARYGRGLIRGVRPLVPVAWEDRSAPGEAGPFVAVLNHRSMVDAILVALLPGELVQVVNTWPFRIPFFGAIARWAGYLNIRRMGADDFFAAAADLLASGVSVVFFPEGTRSRDGNLGAFHSMAFRLAQQTMVPIVPVCLAGTAAVIPPGSKWFRPAPVTVRRLPAISPETAATMTVAQLKTHVRELIAAEVATMEGGPQ